MFKQKYKHNKKLIHNQSKEQLKLIASITVASVAVILSLYAVFAYEVMSYVIPEVKASYKSILGQTIEEKICQAANGEYCEVLINLANCESSLNPNAIHVNKNGTVDLGLFQINTVHQDISNADKMDIVKATQWTLNKIKTGKGRIWVCWDKI